MKKLLNTLYITTQGTYLHRDGETVAVKKDDDILLRVPIHTLEGIVCFGHVLVSPPAMELCAEHGVLISYLSEHGKFWARVQGAVRGNVLLRRQQYRLADDAERSAAIAQTAVMAKIANCRTTLLRAAREREGGLPDVEAAADRLGRALDMLLRQQLPVDRVRGVEGECAQHYFAVFDSLILQQKERFVFRGRSRRPPLDAVNSLLSFVYTLLVHDVTSALESVGLDPYVGFLHVDRPGRVSLALDLIEEFRPILADRLVLSLINRQQVSGDGFTKAESGAVMMDAATRRVVLEAWQKRKQDEVRHPFLDEAAPLGLFPYLQALLLARHVRGDLDAYPALVWK
jgi:CRISPR-associated protein Cas1